MKKKILVCRNCIEECNGLLENLNEIGFNVIAANRDGDEIIKYIKEHQPIVVVCEAFMPHKDAVGVMKKFQNYENSPKFIIVSSSNNMFLEREIMESGASYLVLKPFAVSSLINVIEKVTKKFKASAGATQKRYTLEEKVTNMIHQIGVPAHIKGYHYLRKGIMLCVENAAMLSSVTKALYPEIAQYFQTTPSRVERAIRHAIEVAWDRGDIEILNSYFGYTIHNGRGKPTSSEFIAMISDKIRLERNSLKKMNIAI